MPSGEQVNIAFAKSQALPLSTEYGASLRFTELHLWGLPFFQTKLRRQTIFPFNKSSSTTTECTSIHFDNMTTSIAKNSQRTEEH